MRDREDRGSVLAMMVILLAVLAIVAASAGSIGALHTRVRYYPFEALAEESRYLELPSNAIGLAGPKGVDTVPRGDSLTVGGIVLKRPGAGIIVSHYSGDSPWSLVTSAPPARLDFVSSDSVLVTLLPADTDPPGWSHCPPVDSIQGVVVPWTPSSASDLAARYLLEWDSLPGGLFPNRGPVITGSGLCDTAAGRSWGDPTPGGACSAHYPSLYIDTTSVLMKPNAQVVLTVNGDLAVVGPAVITGFINVNGDLRLSGDVKIFGALAARSIVWDSIGAPPEIRYSSCALRRVLPYGGPAIPLQERHSRWVGE